MAAAHILQLSIMDDLMKLSTQSLTRERNTAWRKCYKYARKYFGNDVGRICAEYGFGKESEIPENFIDIAWSGFTSSSNIAIRFGCCVKCSGGYPDLEIQFGSKLYKIMNGVALINWISTGYDKEFYAVVHWYVSKTPLLQMRLDQFRTELLTAARQLDA